MRIGILMATLLWLALAAPVAAQTDEQPADDPQIEEMPMDELPAEEGEEPLPSAEGAAPSVGELDQPGEGMGPLPEIPSLEEVRAGKATVKSYLPADFDFRIGIVGQFVEETETYSGTETQAKSPLMLLDPRTGNLKIHANNFPAKVIANSTDGTWVVAIAPSAAVEGTSGSASRQAAVSLNLSTGVIKLIKEFPLHSNFQALFTAETRNEVFYCVNEPGAVNQIIRYNLETAEEKPVPVEGNRFYLYGLKTAQPSGLWVKDPMSLDPYPVLSLIDVAAGTSLDQVEFPGTSQVLAKPSGEVLLAAISEQAESSIGYYQVADKTYHQVANLVLTKPDIKWLHNSNAIVVKESTAAKDRFLHIDLGTGTVRELYSAYFNVGQWDISPDDKALVFIVKTNQDPYLFVIPLDPTIEGYNRIKLRGMHEVSWVGCLHAPNSGGGGGSWLNKLLPKF